MMFDVWTGPVQEVQPGLTVEAVLLLVFVVGFAASMPFVLSFIRSQKRMIEEAAQRQAAFEAEADRQAKERADRLTLEAARKIEEQLATTMNRMHERIMKLEGDVREREKRIDAMQDEMAKLHEQSERLKSDVKAMKRRNVELATMVRRTISQLERHEIKPDIDLDQVNQLLAEEEAK